MATTALLSTQITGRIRSTHYDLIVNDLRTMDAFLADTSGTGKVVLYQNPILHDSIISGTASFNLITVATDITLGPNATTINIGEATGLGNTKVKNNLQLFKDLSVTGMSMFTDDAIFSGDISITGTATISGSASIGTNLGVSGDLTVIGNTVISGNLTVQGTTTTLNTSVLDIEDKNITLASGSLSDAAADGGGITLLGFTNKTIIWDSTNSNWTSNQHWNIDSTKTYKINNVEVLSATALGSSVLSSALTSVGTLLDLTVTNMITGSISGTADNVRSTVSINNGGTGATSSSQALTNLLPTGALAGYVLTTSGPGSFYWAAGGTGGGSATGTRIDSTRSFITPTANQTVFTVPTYTPGASQLRLYINGVRQFNSEYTETDGTTVTFTTGLSVDDILLAEVDGYVNYTITADSVTFSPLGSLASTNVQNALAELDSEKLAKAGGVMSGTLELVPGTGTLASFKLGAGVLLNTATPGVVEWNGTSLFITKNDSIRKTIAYLDSSITGNASTATTATTATYLSATQQNNIIVGASIGMAMSSDSSSGSFRCRAPGTGDGNLAGLAFHNDSYAIKMGVRADGYLGIGGWSRANWSWYSDPSGNMVAAGNITAYSDPRLKDNVTKISNAFDIINALDGVTFNWNRRSKLIQSKWDKRDYGMLADQVKAIMPEIVTASIHDDENNETYDTVCYEKIVPVLVEAIKELILKVESLENK